MNRNYCILALGILYWCSVVGMENVSTRQGVLYRFCKELGINAQLNGSSISDKSRRNFKKIMKHRFFPPTTSTRNMLGSVLFLLEQEEKNEEAYRGLPDEVKEDANYSSENLRSAILKLAKIGREHFNFKLKITEHLETMRTLDYEKIEEEDNLYNEHFKKNCYERDPKQFCAVLKKIFKHREELQEKINQKNAENEEQAEMLNKLLGESNSKNNNLEKRYKAYKGRNVWKNVGFLQLV